MGDAEVGPDGSHTTDARAKQMDYWGKRGATRKRLAEVEFLLGDDHWRMTLQEARDDYYKGLQQGGGYHDHWLLGQYVVLGAVLRAAAGHTAAAAKAPPNARATRRGEGDSWWVETCGAVRLGLRSDHPQEQMWAWSSLADLRLVARRERLDIPGARVRLGPFPISRRWYRLSAGPTSVPPCGRRSASSGDGGTGGTTRHGRQARGTATSTFSDWFCLCCWNG